ncbi:MULTISPECIES: ABC transporter permease [unclassified Oceanobacillus]|uniref:ABC transporter permease n=1 Tax=unclassified Oceanobacillus TaxID=2630292 RepID=UPI001BE513DA|nr:MULTISPECIES: ABC transporter permease [unclassified Oceanobacillus]MBT2599217.1 ABC transporter permease [Oceanobacillus sp. ISL-74]MBT2652135.1 ABC transporter permease [Oceanobacillus sp. ISL-73]
MILQLIKKQLLLLLRNPIQLLMLLVLPIILIVILSTALSGFMQGDNPQLTLKIAWLEQQDETSQVDEFLENMNELDVSSDAFPDKDALHMTTTLREDVFLSEELSSMIELQQIDESEKEKIMEDADYTAIIEVPEDFTLELLQAIAFENNSVPQLELFVNQEHQIGAEVVESIIHNFNEILVMNQFMEESELPITFEELYNNEVTGEIKHIEQRTPISSQAYYTIGMAVMNALYVASTLGFFAYREKEIHVFDRLIVADMSRWKFFFSVLISGAIVSFLQLLFIFTFSWLVFKITWPSIMSFLTISLFLALAVGGTTVLLTAISYRINSEEIIGFFSGIIVSIFAFLGGSFFPVGELSPLIQQIGNLTPNGASLSAYIQLLQGASLREIASYILVLICFTFLSILLAVVSYPKRGSK